MKNYLFWAIAVIAITFSSCKDDDEKMHYPVQLGSVMRKFRVSTKALVLYNFIRMESVRWK